MLVSAGQSAAAPSTGAKTASAQGEPESASPVRREMFTVQPGDQGGAELDADEWLGRESRDGLGCSRDRRHWRWRG
jgi:hypothetical protein